MIYHKECLLFLMFSSLIFLLVLSFYFLSPSSCLHQFNILLWMMCPLTPPFALSLLVSTLSTYPQIHPSADLMDHISDLCAFSLSLFTYKMPDFETPCHCCWFYFLQQYLFQLEKGNIQQTIDGCDRTNMLHWYVLWSSCKN